jgi:hypothetical protein
MKEVEACALFARLLLMACPSSRSVSNCSLPSFSLFRLQEATHAREKNGVFMVSDRVFWFRLPPTESDR